MHRLSLLGTLFFIGVLVAGCGGGGGGGSTAPVISGGNSATAAPAPLATAVLAGSMGYVAPDGHTVYVLSADTFNNSVCTSGSGCLGLWPIVTPPGGATIQASSGWWTFTRPDALQQLEYAGWPLYEYAGDSAPGQTNGNGIVSFGGTWSIARPNMAVAGGTPTPPPGGGFSY